MSTHPLLAVLNSTPINRQARKVTSQAGCATVDVELSREELCEVFERLSRKHRLMKSMLRIKTKSQHKNVVSRHNKGQRSRSRPRRLTDEYVRVGLALQVINRRFAEIDRVGREGRQLLGAIENQWKAEHPGAIWDGRQLVAPNGATFSRVAAAQEMH
jgi:hypothetical protein